MPRSLFAVACLLWFATPVSAQCVSSTPPSAIWPTSVVFDPAQPIPGQPFAALLGPPTEAQWQPADVPVRNGNNIDVTGFLPYVTVTPPPATLLRIQFPALPAGQYLVRFRLSGQGGACAPLDVPLGLTGFGSAASVPGPQGAVLAALVLLMLAIAVVARRRRAGRSLGIS
jgi:hypothetical protein